VGKTTFASLLIRTLNDMGKHVLAIDADPDANLAAALGIPNADSIVPIAEMKELLVGYFDGGGVEKNLYNGVVFPPMIYLFRIFIVTADQRYIKLFKELLIELLNYYLKTENGASYISDFDFYLGDLINCWGQAEVEAVFNEDERLLINNLLLACSRQVYAYKEKMWPTPVGENRFNHETFPALSLYRAVQYFETFTQVKDLKKWTATATQCFNGPINEVFKHTENANGYQWLVPCHKFAFDAASGKIPGQLLKTYKKTAYAAVAAVDNFGFGVDYGDTNNPLSNGFFMLSLLDCAATAYNDSCLAWSAYFVRKALKDNPLIHLPAPGWGITGQVSAEVGTAPAAGDWEKLPLEEHMRLKYAPEISADKIFDKLGYRQGWTAEDQFFLFEASSCGMHNHFDCNAILRYNHKGRIWLVDNGYGRLSGLLDASESYKSRE